MDDVIWTSDMKISLLRLVVVWLCIIFYNTWFVESDSVALSTIGDVIHVRSLEFSKWKMHVKWPKYSKKIKKNICNNSWYLIIAKYQLSFFFKFNIIINSPIALLVCFERCVSSINLWISLFWDFTYRWWALDFCLISFRYSSSNKQDSHCEL